MAVDRPVSGVGRGSLSADLIAQRGFTIARRGFEQDEVRAFLVKVSEEVQTLRARIEELDGLRRQAELRAAHPVLDEDTLMGAVGDETASILRAARTASSDLRQRAEQDAARLVEEAEAAAAGLRAEAEALLAQRKDESEQAAAALLSAAQAEAEAITVKAHDEAQEVKAQAERDRKLTVEAAQSVREKILSDLSRRRRVASVQIEQLRAGRERLLEAYGLVRRTLEEVHDDLQRADGEARLAADNAGRKAERDLPPPTVSGATEPVSGVEDEVSVLPWRPPAAPSTPDLDIGPAPGSPAGGAAPSPDLDAPPPPAPMVAQVPPSVVQILPDDEVEQVRVLRGGAANPAPAAAPAPPRATSNGRAAAAVPEAGAVAVDDLFHRIRADREDAVSRARVLLDEPPPAPAELDGDADAGADEDPAERRPDGDEALLQRRDRAVVDIEVALTRKLKRALQDEQNDLLDRLRSLRGAPTAERLLPDEADHVARFAASALPLLRQAAEAGATFAAELRTEHGQPTEALGDPDLDDLAEEVATAIVGPLRQRLEQAIRASAGDDQMVLVEALGSAYREWKSERLERNGGDVVVAAFSRGTWMVVPDGTLLRWVAEDVDGPCPDCDDDGLAGALAKGDAFPTGQMHPPAHSGCRCLLVPAAG